MKVFLDANMLISASHPGSLARKLVRWIVYKAEGITNDYALSEARKNLASRYPERLADLEALAGSLMIINHTVPAPDVELRAKDIPILVGAIASNSTHLVTRDQRDFGPFFGNTIQGVKIVNPDQFVAEAAAFIQANKANTEPPDSP